MGFRFITLNIIFLALFSLIGINLYELQVKNSDYYLKRVQARNEYEEKLHFRRGEIFFTDRHGNEIPAAINKDYPIVYAVPKEIDDPEATAEIVSSMVNISKEKLVERLDDPESLFSLLVDKADDEMIRKINDAKPDGIYISNKQYRYYPFDDLGAHLLGFVGVNDKYGEPTGLYGIESEYNGKLRDEDEVLLTVDRTLQAESENILKELVENYGAEGGSVIIQEPKTGKILTMANLPDFDPNDYGEYPVGSFINPSVQYVYEPGSVFKPLTMAIGIDTGVITPDSTYYDKGYVTLNGKTITNWDHKAYGEATMTNVIEHSINTGAVYAEQQIGRKNFVDYLQKFGFGEKTDIDLPNEIKGSLANLTNKHARDIDFATAGFGQGTAVTPVQLITAYSAIANGGLLMRPYISNEEKPYIRTRVIAEETARQVSGMMESAVTKAHVAAIQGFRVAGKTGTAQVPDFEGGGYTDQYIHTFVGFAPVSDPKFVILMKIDKPNVTLAGYTVVPAFKELAQFVLNYYQIPPDNLETPEP